MNAEVINFCHSHYVVLLAQTQPPIDRNAPFLSQYAIRPFRYVCMQILFCKVDSEKNGCKSFAAVMCLPLIKILSSPLRSSAVKKKSDMKQSHRSQTASTVGVIKENLFTLRIFLRSRFSMLRGKMKKCVKHFNFTISSFVLTLLLLHISR